MLILDAQAHIFGRNTPDRPWTAGMEHFFDRPCFTAEEMIVEMDAAGVDGVVLIPPGPVDGYRHDLVIPPAKGMPGRFKVMGRIDLLQPDWHDKLDALLDEPVIRGFRFSFTGPEEHAYFMSGQSEPVFALLEQAGSRVMFAPYGTYPEIERIAREHPGLPIAISHFGFVRKERDLPFETRLAPLLALAKYPNVSVKATVLPSHSNEPYPFNDLHDPIRRVFDAFGPERMFWGADLTQSSATYPDSVGYFQHIPFLKGEDLEMVMGKSLQAWLGWPEAGSRP